MFNTSNYYYIFNYISGSHFTIQIMGKIVKLVTRGHLSNLHFLLTKLYFKHWNEPATRGHLLNRETFSESLITGFSVVFVKKKLNVGDTVFHVSFTGIIFSELNEFPENR